MKLRIHLISIIIFSIIFNACKTAIIPPESIVAESKNKHLKILIISDLNAGYGSTEYPDDVPYVISQLDSIKPDIILCAGDMVAGQKASLTEEDINAMWSSFKTTVLDPIRKIKIPFGFTLGNHDASPSFYTDRKLAQAFWLDNATATNLSFVDSIHFPFYFSYIKNGVFFISWDAAGSQVPSKIYVWMKEQLNSSIAKNARLRILLGHLPLYPIVEAKNKVGEIITNPDSALVFFKNYGVDVYISGHQHAYFPAKKQGIILFNSGAIGNGPRQLIGHDAAAKKAFSIVEVPVNNPKEFSHQTFIPLQNSQIDLMSLPDSIIGFNGVLKRIDQ